MKQQDGILYEKAILDCERRIGSYISGGGSSEDAYVKTQVSKIAHYERVITQSIKGDEV